MTPHRRLVFAALVVFAPALLVAASVAIPHSFTNGQPADAVQVNANFTALATAVNDNHVRIGALEGSAGTGGTGPLVDAASPSSLPLAGASVLLLGHAFDPPISVLLDGAPMSGVQVLSRTQVRFTAPAKAAGTYDVAVTNASGKTDTFPAAIEYVTGHYPNAGDFAAVIYVSTTGNDTTGDGTAGLPFLTLKRAIEVAPSGAGISIAPGTYRLVPMTTSGAAAGIDDLGKALTIWGTNATTVLEVYGSDTSAGSYRDAHVFFFRNAGTVVSNVAIRYFPNRSANYSNAVFGWSAGKIRNVSIENASPTVSMSMNYYNSGPAGAPTVVNTTITTHGRLTSDYSGNATYVNCQFEQLPSSGGKTYSVTRAPTTVDFSAVTLPLDLRSLGDPTITNPDGTRSHIGVGGGTYLWP